MLFARIRLHAANPERHPAAASSVPILSMADKQLRGALLDGPNLRTAQATVANAAKREQSSLANLRS